MDNNNNNDCKLENGTITVGGVPICEISSKQNFTKQSKINNSVKPPVKQSREIIKIHENDKGE